METENKTTIKWYNYVACFFSGFFLASFVPHFIKGICGDTFPSPFANPPGIGLSSPLINVLWALFNLIVGYLLYRVSKISNQRIVTVIIFFISIAVASIMHAIHFADKMKQ